MSVWIPAFVEIQKRFYEDVLGLEVLHDWDAMIVFKERFGLHQADHLLPANEAAQFICPGKQGSGNVIVYFEADDIQQAYEQIKEKDVEIVHGVLKLPWQRIFRIYDPDRHIIEIGEPH